MNEMLAHCDSFIKELVSQENHLKKSAVWLEIILQQVPIGVM
jgi:hypothetical protein